MEGLTRIKQIVADLKLYAREPADHLEPVSLADVTSEALRLTSVRLKSLAKLTIDVSPSLPRVRVHRRHLMQVVVNLLMNSADAVEELGGSRPPEVTIRARQDGDRLFLSVEDNGPGLSPAAKEKLFEPFFTTKPVGKGTGLGLSLAHDYVVRDGGRLVASDRAGGGACLTIELAAIPVGAASADDDLESTVVSRPPQRGSPAVKTNAAARLW
jgi:C4-dicarboxylate-specific signal transduction histidine kinase